MILVGAAMAALLVQRFRLAGIPVYLLTGAALGPHSLDVIAESQELEGISHLALVLLLFGVGLDLHLDALRQRWARTLGLGLSSIALTVALGYPVARGFGLDPGAALAVAMVCSLSSTAVVLRLLAQRRELRHLHGRLSLSVLVIQDLVVLGMLALLPALADGGRFAMPTPGSLLKLCGAFGLVLVGRSLLPRLMQKGFDSRSLEVGMLVGIAAALSFAEATRRLGFSLEMGAFVAGFALAGTPFRHQLSSQIGPLRDLFLAIFFTTLGTSVEPAVVAQHWDVVLLGTVALLVVKSVAISASSLFWGTTATVGVAIGLGLAQAGEFSLVLLAASRQLGILGAETTSVVVAMTVLSLIATPALLDLSRRLERRIPAWAMPWSPGVWRDRGGRARREPRAERPVLIVGFGPIGAAVARHVDARGMPHAVIELNPLTAREEAAKGRRIVFGDARQPEVLQRAGVREARAVVITIPDERAVARICATVKGLRPGLPIVARVTTTAQARSIEAAASHVVVDELATAEALLRVMDEEVEPPPPPPPEDPIDPLPPPSAAEPPSTPEPEPESPSTDDPAHSVSPTAT